MLMEIATLFVFIIFYQKITIGLDIDVHTIQK